MNKLVVFKIYLNIKFTIMNATTTTAIFFPKNLSPSQSKILFHLCQGRMYKEIACVEKISINTVKNHIKTIFKKLEVSNRTEACNILINLNFENGKKII